MMPRLSLTVPAEAIRGLRYENQQWILYVSDPEPMAVSKFKLSTEALKSAAEDVHREYFPPKPLMASDGTGVMDWVLNQNFINVELIEAGGLPSMFPGFKGSGPKPDMGMNGPEVPS